MVNQSLPPMHASSRLKISDVTATVLSESNPVHPSLFGSIRDMVAKPWELSPYRHPRVVVGVKQWNEILSMYADEKNFYKEDSWSNYFRRVSMVLGPNSRFIEDVARLERSGATRAYRGLPFARTKWYEQYQRGLAGLAERITMSSASNSDSFPICALWASVALKQRQQGRTPFIDPGRAVETCINATVGWSKVVLAHRSFHCTPDCRGRNSGGGGYGQLWDTRERVSLQHHWVLGGTGLALAYDLLYEHLTIRQRRTVRSAVALFVMKRWTWGTSLRSTRESPNAKTHPHRIFSNWAGYNGNIYLANLAIEGGGRV